MVPLALTGSKQLLCCRLPAGSWKRPKEPEVCKCHIIYILGALSRVRPRWLGSNLRTGTGFPVDGTWNLVWAMPPISISHHVSVAAGLAMQSYLCSMWPLYSCLAISYCLYLLILFTYVLFLDFPTLPRPDGAMERYPVCTRVWRPSVFLPWLPCYAISN